MLFCCRYYDREDARNSQEIHGVNLLKADGHYLYLQMNGDEFTGENTAKRDEYIFEEGEKSVLKKQLKEEKKIYYYTHEDILTLYVHNTYIV